MSIAALKDRLLEAEARAALAESLVEAFKTGDVPDGGNFDHVIMAQWGRKRLAEREKNQVAALLRSDR